MMSFVQDRSAASLPVFDALPGIQTGSGFPAGIESVAPVEEANDSVRRLPGPCASQSPSCNQEGVVAQLLSVITELLSMIGLGRMFGGGSGNESFFETASGSSTGDPHLAFDGTAAAGTVQQRFDSMTPHPDLARSDSFFGGYTVSTATTQPNGSGATYNQQAAIVTGFGNTQVSLSNTGAAEIVQNGVRLPLADGQSYELGNGETVTRSSNGSVTVGDTNARGGTITTILRKNGNGVDVSLQAHNVDLGGDLPGGAALRSPNDIAQPMGERS